jgi:hypothetical protein
MTMPNLEVADEIAQLGARMMRALDQICSGASAATVQSAQLSVASALLARVLTAEDVTVLNAILGQHGGWRLERMH